MRSFLTRFKEPAPFWLTEYNTGDTPDIRAILESRLVYYPGSGFDTQPVRTCVQAGCAHLFLYADYGIPREKLDGWLQTAPFGGYRIAASAELSPDDLYPSDWHSSVDLPAFTPPDVEENEPPYAFLAVFEREKSQDRTRRFAVIFLFADGIATYDALFGNKNAKPPFIIVLQDHQNGKNYSCFGAAGLMDRIARKTRVFPEFAMVGLNTRPWECFEKEPYVFPEHSGIRKSPRFLYRNVLDRKINKEQCLHARYIDKNCNGFCSSCRAGTLFG